MNDKQHIFISHAHADDAFAQRLVPDLQAAGFEPWVDVQEISAGADYFKNINEALETARVLIVVASRSALQSRWVQYEWQSFLAEIHSRQVQASIIPVLIDIPAEEVPFALRQFPFVDFRGDYDGGITMLLAALSRTITPQQPRPPAKNKSKGYVFFSYVEEDTAFVDKLRSFMGELGYAYWDYQESDRDYHTQLVVELEEVIHKAAATFCILSPDWKSSVWTLKEYFFCLEVKVPVFLLKVREIGPTLAIAGEHYIDFIQSENRGFERLRRELARKNL